MKFCVMYSISVFKDFSYDRSVWKLEGPDSGGKNVSYSARSALALPLVLHAYT